MCEKFSTTMRRKGLGLVLGPGLALLLPLGCVPGEVDDPTGLGTVTSAYGLDHNGLNPNGLDHNGLNANGLNANGLNANGLGKAGFTAWFDSNPGPSVRSQTMKYLVACACNSPVSYTDPSTGIQYTWPGVFGLAPNWCAGNMASTADEEWVTACLMAHVNSAGDHVLISLRGTQVGLAVGSATEKVLMSGGIDGVFYGNLFKATETNNNMFTRAGTCIGTGAPNGVPAPTNCYGWSWDLEKRQEWGRACAADPTQCSGVFKNEGGIGPNCVPGTGADVFTSCDSGTWNHVITVDLPVLEDFGNQYAAADGNLSVMNSGQSTNVTYVASNNAASNYSNGCMPPPCTPGSTCRDSSICPALGYCNASPLYCSGSYARSKAVLATSALSWVGGQDLLHDTGMRALNIIYSNGSGHTCNAYISIDNGAHYATYPFASTGGWDTFNSIHFNLNFDTTTPIILIGSVGDGSCAPNLDWFAITPPWTL